jgi:hypothetical protein
VLGDDLSLLSRQRDSELPSLLTEPSLPSWDDAPATLLDQFNERWVHASTFLSPTLLVELLRLMGESTHEWYASVNPESVGEPVLLFGEGPAPYWSIAAREYLERWVHHLQIRRALGIEPGPVSEPPFGPRAWDVVALALPTLFALVVPAGDASVVVSLGERAWTYTRGDTGQWDVRSFHSDDSTVTLSVEADDVTTLLSRGLTRERAERSIVATGDRGLAEELRASMAGVMSRYHADP